MTAVGAGVSVAALRVTLLTVAVASSFSNGAFVGNAVMSESPHGLGSTAVVFLVTRMSPETADFATEVARLPGFHVYVLPDQEPEGVDLTLRRLPEDDPGYTLTPLESESNGTQWRGKGSPVEILRVARAKCQWEGFTHAARGWHQMRYMDIILPLEKALYYFTRVDDSHDFVWMLEDDIFIPGPKSLYDVHVAHPLADFLGPQKPHRCVRHVDSCILLVYQIYCYQCQ